MGKYAPSHEFKHSETKETKQMGPSTGYLELDNALEGVTGSLMKGLSPKRKLKEEVDPNGVSQHDSGAKLDSGKPDASLLGMFGNALLQVARVGTFGAEKYTRGGWQHVPDGINRYSAAMLRHYLKEINGPKDDDLPVLHAAQVAWNALARLELMCRDYNNSVEAERRGG